MLSPLRSCAGMGTRPQALAYQRALRCSEVHDVDVRTESHVEGEVPADVVRIVIDHNLVAIPEPAVAKSNVRGSDIEVESAKPEAAGAASRQMPNVALPDATREASVLPGVIEMIVGISLTGVVPNPLAVGVDVRSIGMPSGVAIVGFFLRRGCGFRVADRGRAFLRDIPGMFCWLGLGVLCKNGDWDQQEYRQDQSKLVHVVLQLKYRLPDKDILCLIMRKYQIEQTTHRHVAGWNSTNEQPQILYALRYGGSM